MKSTLKLVLLSLALITGAGGAHAAQPQYSGFLGDYSNLQTAKDREGISVFLDRSRDFKGYTKVMFDPPEVVLTPNPDYKGVQPDALKRMTDAVVGSFRKALEPAYQVVQAPGPDVLRVRIAITNVQPARPDLKATDLIPMKAVFNVGRAAAGAAPQVAEMSAEIEVLDEKGGRVAAAVATRKGDKTLPQGEQVTWSQLEPIAAYWAGAFRQRLDELRGAKAQ